MRYPAFEFWSARGVRRWLRENATRTELERPVVCAWGHAELTWDSFIGFRDHCVEHGLVDGLHVDAPPAREMTAVERTLAKFPMWTLGDLKAERHRTFCAAMKATKAASDAQNANDVLDEAIRWLEQRRVR